MQNTFDKLIDSYLSNKVGIVDDFLSAQLSNDLKQNLNDLYSNDQFKAAGTGETKEVSYDTQLRGDEIYWLDRSHENEHENSFFDQMDEFIKYLNETCYTGIKSYEFHYARYDTGTFYKKHIDQFRSNDSRKFSMIMYLNENWVKSDGGELCIHHDEAPQYISPSSGKSVFFQSDELVHEVLITNVPRFSITGWLKV